MPTVAIDASAAAGPEEALHGSGRYVRELLRALHFVEGLDLRALQRRGPGPELLWEQVGLPLALAARRPRAAIVHAPNCFLPLRRPCPGVVTIHDLAFEVFPADFSARTGWKYRTFARRAALSAERVICVSTFTRDDVCERYGVDPARVRVVPNAPALPVGAGPPPPGPYLLAVGDLRAKKNGVTLVRAFRRLRAAGAPHALIFAGPDAGGGARLRAEAGAEPVHLTGYVSDERLDALIRGADALVHPSLYEGFGLAPVEAMARGCPVAAARATALPETCGDAAALFDPHDDADLARVLSELLTDAVLRERLVARGRARAAQLSWERTAVETATVYRELL